MELGSQARLQRGGKDHLEDKCGKSERETEKTGGGLQIFQCSGESNGSTWFWFELSVFCHAGELVSHKVMYNTLLITFWPPGSPHSAFPSPHPSPSISIFSGVLKPRPQGHQSIQVFYPQRLSPRQLGTPDLPGGSENPLGLLPLEDQILTTLPYANRNCTIYCFSSTYEAMSWKCDVTQRWQVTSDWYQVLKDP